MTEPSVQLFSDLPEPARARAAQFYRQLLQQGEEEKEATRQARQLVGKWVRERAPGSKGDVPEE